MNHQLFSLQPFPGTKKFPDVKIAGNIARHSNNLTIQYSLLGDIKEIAITPPSATPLRKHGLWQNTCFEFFIGVRNSPQYWEFNLSPCGDWNIYRFDDYRQGMQEEAAFSTLPFMVQQQAESVEINLNLDLDKIISTEQALEVAITTVIKTQDGDVTYWALTHRGAEADFHLRDSFILELPAVN
ncbi:DOMON-like domain-containing protein [Tolypothrix sp. PCC 7910]|uniref:DOMON-like domain-containing protein n=1 Tax=Tolypothrix sp. PCC 7910 TaxID=2099387 RepID=UPI00142773E7|nr:DOMON-like domain-containing protein [Tolypothrix sp. PCC 7910]QIR39225.1 DOMON-like domain-containing protein [Tolypothrix sp. PCC 7910]